jgi:hypothetical protein
MAPDLVAAFDALLSEGATAAAPARDWHVLDMAHGRVPVAMVADELTARAACETWNGTEGRERFKVVHAPAMVPQPCQQPQARHLVRNPATGRFAPAQAPAAPELPPVIDDVPAEPAPVLKAAPALVAPVRPAPAHQDPAALMVVAAAALAVLAVLVTLVLAGPKASAHGNATAPVHLALAVAGPRAPPAAEAAACGRVAGKGEHAWQVEAARLTASTGTRSTVASLRATCAPAAR